MSFSLLLCAHERARTHAHTHTHTQIFSRNFLVVALCSSTLEFTDQVNYDKDVLTEDGCMQMKVLQDNKF